MLNIFKFLIYPILFGILSTMNIYETPFLVDNSEVHYSWENVWKFMFNRNSCVQIFSDESQFSRDVESELFSFSFVGSIINNPREEIISCRNVVVIWENLDSRNTTLMSKAPRWFKYQLLLIVNESSLNEGWLNKTDSGKFLFQDAEGLLLISGDHLMYIRHQPYQDLKEVKTLVGKWDRMDNGITDFFSMPLYLATFNCNLFSYLGPLDDNGFTDRVLGVEGIILSEISVQLNLSLKVVVPPESNKWGRLENGTWDGGILKLITQGSADLAFCGLWMDVSMLETGLEMSYPIGDECQSFLVPRPQPITTGSHILFKPFQPYVWMCILLFFLLFIGLLYMFGKLTRQWVPHNKRFLRLENCFFEILTILLTGGSTIKKLTGGLRQLIFTYVLKSFLLVTCFSSGLVSQLTMPIYSEKMDSLEKLVENNYYWTTTSFPDSTMMFDLENPLEYAWSQRYIPTETRADVESLYSADKRMALVGHQIGGGLNVDEPVTSQFLQNFEVGLSCRAVKYYSFGYRKGSPYVDSINKIILKFQSAGLISKSVKDTFDYIALSQPYVYELLRFEKTHISEHKSLALKNVKGVFQLLVVGLIIATLVFICEILFSKKSKVMDMIM